MTREVFNPPTTAGSVLEKVLEGLGLTAAFSRHNVIRLWPSIVNKTVARHAKAARVSGSTLHVIVDSSVWMNEMATLKKVLLSKINACLDKGAPPLTDIRFQQGSWAREQDAETAVSSLEPEMDEKELRLIQKSLESIRSEDLKHTLARIREKDLRLKRRRANRT
jgi:predicted nucleic acid-binding Zn ribbon protein